MSSILENAKKHYNATPTRYTPAKQWSLSLGGYKPFEQQAIRLSGVEADASEFDDNGLEVWGVAGGEHHGHVVIVTTAKHNCGAYDEEQRCSCGQWYANAMHGCWQQGHQREEHGTPII